MKFIKGTYTYYHYSPKKEINLKNSILKGENIFSSTSLDEAENVSKVNDKILSLPIEKQIHVIHCIVDTMYWLSGDDFHNKNIESFLAQNVFSNHRDIILTIVDADLTNDEKNQKISLFENELGIKITSKEISWKTTTKN